MSLRGDRLAGCADRHRGAEFPYGRGGGTSYASDCKSGEMLEVNSAGRLAETIAKAPRPLLRKLDIRLLVLIPWIPFYLWSTDPTRNTGLCFRRLLIPIKTLGFPSQFIQINQGVKGHTTRASPGVPHTRAGLEPGTSRFSTLHINQLGGGPIIGASNIDNVNYSVDCHNTNCSISLPLDTGHVFRLTGIKE